MPPWLSPASSSWLPDSFLFLTEPRYWAVAGAAALAGLVRGFSGFGGAMVFMPIASLLYEPKLAAILLFIADDIAALAMLPAAVRRCIWREVLLLGIAAVIAVPFGVALLVVADADVMRWVICLVILLAVVLMALGWRYTGRLGLPATLGTGMLAGLSGGAAALPGPPVVLLWLGGQGNAATVRANLIVFFGFTATASGIAYWWSGLFTQTSLLMSLPLIPAYLLPLSLGSRLFARSSEQQFRRVALALCAFAALSGLPLWRLL
ncbi:sulfite exporter TauE/SafE family protein [Ferrovibrio terrae]|uniref:Probable membrane transporter protein n=1 Tax=Ferrovibrio terrae TaxID=2594003 RepID=A0A516H074_9PROT|nr:sulfite exporter TauE/SafE family protein [Ferrovibrio terrae]